MFRLCVKYILLPQNCGTDGAAWPLTGLKEVQDYYPMSPRVRWGILDCCSHQLVLEVLWSPKADPSERLWTFFWITEGMPSSGLQQRGRHTDHEANNLSSPWRTVMMLMTHHSSHIHRWLAQRTSCASDETQRTAETK